MLQKQDLHDIIDCNYDFSLYESMQPKRLIRRLIRNNPKIDLEVVLNEYFYKKQHLFINIMPSILNYYLETNLINKSFNTINNYSPELLSTFYRNILFLITNIKQTIGDHNDHIILEDEFIKMYIVAKLWSYIKHRKNKTASFKDTYCDILYLLFENYDYLFNDDYHQKTVNGHFDRHPHPLEVLTTLTHKNTTQSQQRLCDLMLDIFYNSNSDHIHHSIYDMVILGVDRQKNRYFGPGMYHFDAVTLFNKLSRKGYYPFTNEQLQNMQKLMDEAGNGFWERNNLALWILMDVNQAYISEHMLMLKDVFEKYPCVELPDGILSIIFEYTVQCVYDYRAILENRMNNKENGGKYMRYLHSAYKGIQIQNERLKLQNDVYDPPMNEDLMQWIHTNFEPNLYIMAEMDRKEKKAKQLEKAGKRKEKKARYKARAKERRAISVPAKYLNEEASLKRRERLANQTSEVSPEPPRLFGNSDGSDEDTDSE